MSDPATCEVGGVRYTAREASAANACEGCAGRNPDGRLNSKVCNALPPCLPGPDGKPCVWVAESGVSND